MNYILGRKSLLKSINLYHLYEKNTSTDDLIKS